MKCWRGKEQSDDKIIVIVSKVIYRCNPSDFEIDQYITDFKNGIIPQKNVTGIPLHYIQEIIHQEGKNHIRLVMAKDSEEHLKVSDELIRQDILNFFKNYIVNAKLTTEKYSWLKAGKKPLIAAGVVLGLFLWTLPYAISYDNGYEYDVSNGHYFTLTAIILSFASLGLKNVIAIFSALLLIALTSFYLKSRNPPTFHTIRWRQELE
ncbi:MAG: hypothetical protein NTW29_22750 [Bacteroidetes bacterium]|nr:hypothetical protein [Bacteroidota bacterium]